MEKLVKAVKSFVSDESGATMVEYALMIALVAAACVTTATSLGTAISGKFTAVAGDV